MTFAPSPKPPSLRGLGDLVAVVAEPVKEWLQSNVSINWFKDCHCEDRKEFLIRMLPFHSNAKTLQKDKRRV